MMASKTATMPLIMAMHTAPMAFTIAIRHEPMAPRTFWIQDKTAPMTDDVCCCSVDEKNV